MATGDANDPRPLLDELKRLRQLLGEDGAESPGVEIPLLDDIIVLPDDRELTSSAAEVRGAVEPLDTLHDGQAVDAGDSWHAPPSAVIFPGALDRQARPSFTLHNVRIDEDPVQAGDATPISEPQPASAPDREALLDEVIAACMPLVEQTLREHLQSLSPERLRQLLDP